MAGSNTLVQVYCFKLHVILKIAAIINSYV